MLFDGRARRKEYWMFALFYAIIIGGLIILGAILGSIAGFLGTIFSVLYSIASLGLLLPTIAIGIRRMHDVGKSGWYLLIPIYNLILAVTEGTPGDNEYGPDPKAGENA